MKLIKGMVLIAWVAIALFVMSSCEGCSGGGTPPPPPDPVDTTIVDTTAVDTAK